MTKKRRQDARPSSAHRSVGKMHRVVASFAVVCGLLSLVACQTAADRAKGALFRHQQYLRDAARTTVVDPGDGISEVEAYKIGLMHFASRRTSCGYVSDPKDEGDAWRVVVYIGLAPMPVEDLRIRKSDGLTIDSMATKQRDPVDPAPRP